MRALEDSAFGEMAPLPAEKADFWVVLLDAFV
jgi:hypothetical protein